MRAQLLDARRPADLLAVVQRLTLLQIDPTAAIAPNADLVAWSRLGSAYRPADLKRALEEDRTLFELDALVRPMGDLGLYLAGASRLRDLRALARVAGGQRPFPPGRAEAAAKLRAAQLARHPRHGVGAVGVHRLDERPQRHADARVPDAARRGRDRRARGARARCGTWPSASTRAASPSPSVEEAERTRNERRLAVARHRPREGDRRCRSSRSTSATPASRRSSRA